MTQEEKQLLLQDLCARLPYGVKAYVYGYDEEKGEVEVPLKIYSINTSGYVYFNTNKYNINYLSVNQCRLYLRPMSSMTDEEKRHVSKMMCLKTYGNGVVYDIPYDVYTPYYVMEDCLNYLRSIHVDYLGLIPMGLALEAPEGMYN